MTEAQAFEILELIAEVYPQFKVTERKVEIWLPGLMKMDYEGVKHNLENYILEKPYPPTPAEIASYPKEENLILERYRNFEKQAKENPATDEARERFWNSMKRIFGAKEGVVDE